MVLKGHLTFLINILLYAAVAESRTYTAIKITSKINVTLCANNCTRSGDVKLLSLTFSVPRQCYPIDGKTITTLTGVKLEGTSPFGNCIILYNGKGCTGEFERVQAQSNYTSIDTTTIKNKKFNKNSILGFQLCILHDFRVQAENIQVQKNNTGQYNEKAGNESTAQLNHTAN